MGDNFFPNDLSIIKIDNLIELDNHSLVQFYHRNLAYILIIYVFFLSIYIYRNKILSLFQPLKLFIVVLIIQAILE